MKSIFRHIPNFITSLNLVSGTLATIFAIDGHLVWAGVFICLAAVFDFMDGFAARLLNAKSNIGKELDSLSDVVSFGVAPGAILFTLLEFALFGKNQPIYDIAAHWYEWLILFSAFLLPVFGALRLARFNTSAPEDFFRGLPIPANGIFWASFGFLLESPGNHELFKYLYSTQNLLAFGIFMAGMMVINLPMFSFKFHSLQLKENWYRYLYLVLCVVLFALFNVYGLTFAILLYIVLNFIFYLFKVSY